MGVIHLGIVLLLFNICEISANPPSLFPNVEEIALSENETLEFKCTGQKNVTFIYSSDQICWASRTEPTREHQYLCTSNKPNITYEYDGMNYSALFRRENIIYKETGWYGCIENDKLITEGWDGLEWIGLTPDYFKNSEVAWIYVYIKSNEYTFVKQSEFSYIVWVEEKIGDDAFFPCQPTSPDIKTEFIFSVGMNRTIIHDRKLGYTVKNITLKDNGSFMCHAINGSENRYITYYFKIEDKYSNLHDPIIIDDSSEPLIPGGTLKLNCSAVTSHGFLYLLRWKVPRKSDRLSYEYYEERNFHGLPRVYRVLTIEGVTPEDAGEYSCEYVSPLRRKQNSASINITIQDASLAFIPKVSPNVDEIHLQENDALELNCICPKAVFISPKNLTNIHTSPVEIHVTNRTKNAYSMALKRNKTVYGDTGWYGCVSSIKLASSNLTKNSDLTPYNYNSSDIKWIYVYVQSNTNHFIQSLDTMENFRSENGHDYENNLTIPCRPTSPEYKIKLLKNGKEVGLSDRITFDPRRGFVITDLGVKDSAYYQCLDEGEDLELDYYIHVTREIAQYLHKPYINYSVESLIVEGELRINCSIELDRHINPLLNWTIPNENAEVSKTFYREQLNSHVEKSVLQLMMKNFSKNDEGEYTCSVDTFSRKKSVSINLTLDDAVLEFRKLKLIEVKVKTDTSVETQQKTPMEKLMDLRRSVDDLISSTKRQLQENFDHSPKSFGYGF